jgi:phosphoglycerate dehydrogenase-like enzyme
MLATRMKLLVLGRREAPHFAPLAALPGVEVCFGERPEDFPDQARGAEAILAGFHGRRLLEPLLPMVPEARWIHTLSAGLDHVLFPALVESPIVVTNARGAFSRALAEFAVAGLLFFAKDLRRMLRAQAERRWEPFDVSMLAGRVVGIVGLGDIGRAVASALRPLGARILALRRSPAPDPSADEVFAPSRRLEMLRASDDLVVAAPLTPETRGLIGADELAALRPAAVVVNVGRGPVVDEAALVRALAEGRILGAALDVFEREPLPPEHALFGLPNVLLSPHCADHVAGWREASVALFLDNLARFQLGEPLLNVVDKRLGY